jgi:PQQ-dependent dehydrogenase (methanol/ethanol family)
MPQLPFPRKLCARSAVATVLALCSPGCDQQPKAAAKAGPAEGVGHVDGPIRTIAPLPGAEWTSPNGDLANLRYSPLHELTPENVAKLHVVATMSTGIPHGHEGGPLVVGTTMYVVTPYPNNLIAVDLTKPGGAMRWKYEPHPDPRAQGIACCDVVNRGASFAQGKIIYNTLDAQTVAVDAETGKEVWRTRTGNIDVGETVTMAPLVVKDKVIVGNSGGELGVRGWILALDLTTGNEVWRAYNTGSDQDVRIGHDFRPFYVKDQGRDLGLKSWPAEQWKLGGSTVWGWVSYDPELDLIYYGTGNPGVWNAGIRPGDNKWSCSIIARDPDDGMARWAYQTSKNDAWDYDEIMENILVDMSFGGRMRKLLIHPGRTGFVYVLDRVTGELLSAEKFMPSTNWATGYDLKTGEANEDPQKRPHYGKVVTQICPSSTGAKEFVPSAFSPRTGLLYIPAHNTCMDFEGIEANYVAGTPYLGADVKMYPGKDAPQGQLIAWDVARGKRAWTIDEGDLPLYSGVLATGSDLVFYGDMKGWFKAVDGRTGKPLWKFQTGSGIVGNPITYVGPDGKQYVAVYSGVGGWMGATALPEVSTDDPYAALGTVGAMAPIKKYTAPGSMLYVFGL